MKPGPKPKPTAIRKFEGNPGNDTINEHEPKPPVCVESVYVDWMNPDCEYMGLDTFPLKEVAKKMWDEFFPQLTALGVLTEVDRTKFATYCDTFARWLKVKAFIDKNGETYPIYGYVYEPGPGSVDAKGNPIAEDNPTGAVRYVRKKHLKAVRKFPQVDLYLRMLDTIRRYEEEFGIGAASRTRIQAIIEAPFGKEDAKVDDFDYAGKQKLRAVK